MYVCFFFLFEIIDSIELFLSFSVAISFLLFWKMFFFFTGCFDLDLNEILEYFTVTCVRLYFCLISLKMSSSFFRFRLLFRRVYSAILDLTINRSKLPLVIALRILFTAANNSSFVSHDLPSEFNSMQLPYRIE